MLKTILKSALFFWISTLRSQTSPFFCFSILNPLGTSKLNPTRADTSSEICGLGLRNFLSRFLRNWWEWSRQEGITWEMIWGRFCGGEFTATNTRCWFFANNPDFVTGTLLFDIFEIKRNYINSESKNKKNEMLKKPHK